MSGMSTRTGFGGMRQRLVRWVRRYVNAHCIHIVTYHSVGPSDGPFTVGVPQRHTPEEFAAHMAYLRRHYRPVSLRRVVESLEQDRPLERAVVVTFDDGFRDVLTHALPILREMQIPSTMFLVTSVVGNSELMWRHKLTWLITNGLSRRVFESLQQAYRARGVEVPAESFCRAADAPPDLYELTRRYFRTDVVPPVLDALLAEHGWSGPALARQHRPYVELDDVRHNDPEWLEFGNHTHTHPMLSEVSPDEQINELTTASDLILKWTGRRPLAAAYPFGLRDSYDAAAAEAVRMTGHRAALDLRRRLNAGPVSPFDLSRMPAPRQDPSAFERAIDDWSFTSAPVPAADDQVLLSRRMFRGVPKPVRLDTPGTTAAPRRGIFRRKEQPV